MEDAPEPQGVLLSGEDNVAVRVKVEREARGWSTTVLSDRMNEAGFEMNPSAVWRIENRKRRINLDEAIGFAEVFGIELRNLVGPPHLAAQAHAMRLIDDIVDAWRTTQRARTAFEAARDAFDSYIADHPDIAAEAEAVISSKLAAEAPSSPLPPSSAVAPSGDTNTPEEHGG